MGAPECFRETVLCTCVHTTGREQQGSTGGQESEGRKEIDMNKRLPAVISFFILLDRWQLYPGSRVPLSYSWKPQARTDSMIPSASRSEERILPDHHPTLGSRHRFFLISYSTMP